MDDELPHEVFDETVEESELLLSSVELSSIEDPAPIVHMCSLSNSSMAKEMSGIR